MFITSILQLQEWIMLSYSISYFWLDMKINMNNWDLKAHMDFFNTNKDLILMDINKKINISRNMINTQTYNRKEYNNTMIVQNVHYTYSLHKTTTLEIWITFFCPNLSDRSINLG